MLDDVTLSEGQVDSLINNTVDSVAQQFSEQWKDSALKQLGSTSDVYINSIEVDSSGSGKATVSLNGWLPNAIESGNPPFDMKSSLLSGPSAKTGKDGTKYNTVPFGFKTPNRGSKGETSLPRSVYDVVRVKPANIPVGSSGKVRSSGLRPEEIPSNFREPKAVSLPPMSGGSRTYEHKSSIYEGVHKVKEPSSSRSEYTSFRRVSEKSDPDSFIHPGFKKSDIGQNVYDSFDLDKKIGESVNSFLSEFGLI